MPIIVVDSVSFTVSNRSSFTENIYCISSINTFGVLLFLNQARAGHSPARAWFLRIASVRELQYVCLFVCVHLRGYQ